MGADGGLGRASGAIADEVPRNDVVRCGGYRDDKRVLDCLQRALKVGAMCGTHVFIQVLDR